MAEKRVLIVHDDATFVSQVKAAIESSGASFELVSALSGPRALGMVNNQRPDVIVVDAELVGMDGYTLTKQLKSEEATSQIPVIIVSLQPSEASALKARQAGAAAHMPSSGSVDKLVERIGSLAGSGSVAAPSAPAPAPAPAPASSEPLGVQSSAGADVSPAGGYGAPQPVESSGGSTPPPPPPDVPRAANGAPAGYGT
ncbi:MAG: response regulator, partial [Actinomycetota bacterium]|nr:response regulator [Actinomycetota bacterium]